MIARIVVAFVLAVTASTAAAGDREPCAQHDPLRNVYFGDLHVHTALSLDASTQDTRNRPDDAYRFARGEPLGIQPYDAQGRPLRSLSLARPLDFAAVTDHAEFLGEIHTCLTPGLPGHGSVHCWIFRELPRLAYFLFNSHAAFTHERYSFCDENGATCLEAAHTPWAEIQTAAEHAYDRTSACRFTSFVAYEWTGSGGRDASNLHRNVIFANAAVPELPLSFIDEPLVERLWRRLTRACAERGDGCDFVSIPHNSNLSAERIFELSTADGSPFDADDARERARAEPLVEIIQHKGDSECRLGVGTNDELCTFEKLPYDTFMGTQDPGYRPVPGPLNFVRQVLAQGLVHETRLGANPFRFGLIGSTDTHLATPGYVNERRHPGHGGAGPPLVEVPRGLPDRIEFNPGGLVALWAEENSRAALFAALRRREAYATSGPRLTVRLFAGWDHPADLCAASDFARQGYANGVPMGGVLHPPETAAERAPALAVWAVRDPGTAEQPGTQLQRVQIVKLWAEGSDAHERVYDVAGDPANGASVDVATCTPQGAGFDSLCTVWRDPDFDPAQHALYYGRVLENPTCRWSTFTCNALGVDCSRPGSLPDDVAPCCDTAFPKTIQERAWTSPIWYAPGSRSEEAAASPRNDGASAP